MLAQFDVQTKIIKGIEGAARSPELAWCSQWNKSRSCLLALAHRYLVSGFFVVSLGPKAAEMVPAARMVKHGNRGGQQGLSAPATAQCVQDLVVCQWRTDGQVVSELTHTHTSSCSINKEGSVEPAQVEIRNLTRRVRCSEIMRFGGRSHQWQWKQR